MISQLGKTGKYTKMLITLFCPFKIMKQNQIKMFLIQLYLYSRLHSCNRCSDSDARQLHNLNLDSILRADEDELFICAILERNTYVLLSKYLPETQQLASQSRHQQLELVHSQ